MSTTRTDTLHVVPKADVDAMFRIMQERFEIPEGYMLQVLRGRAYANTFLATRTIVISDEE